MRIRSGWQAKFPWVISATLSALLFVGCAQSEGSTDNQEEISQAATSLTLEQVENAVEDKSTIYDSSCYASYESSDLGSDCQIVTANGENAAGVRNVVVVGDSHAAQWLPALEVIAENEDWNLTFYGKRGCPFAINQHGSNESEPYPACSEWNEALQERLRTDMPEVLITSNYSREEIIVDGVFVRDHDAESELAAGMTRAWGPMIDMGVDFIVIRDTPYLGYNSPKCLTENIDSPDKCRTTFQEAVINQAHPDSVAAEQLPGINMVDLTNSFCRDAEYCYSIENDTIIWRDTHHMTGTFAASLVPELGAQLDVVLNGE